MKLELYQRYPRSSSFYAYSHCDVSFELMRAAGEEPPNIFSDRGTEVHAILAGKRDPALAGDGEVELAAELDMLDKQLGSLLYTRDDLDEEHSEERLFYRNGLIPLYSGQPDRWRLYGNRQRVYLPDFKTGWHPMDHYVATNCQIRSYVPLVDELYGRKLERVTAAIHKPGRKSPPAVFERPEIEGAREWAVEVVQRITRPGPKSPTRGPWCTYCSGKVICPLWRNEIETLAPLADAAVTDIPDLVLAELAPRLDLAKTVIEKLQARLKVRVAARPDLFPGWSFAPGEAKRSIEPAKNGKAFDILVTETAALSFSEFLASGRLAVTSLEDQVRRSRKLSALSAREFLNTKLAGIIEKKLPEPHLVYDPGASDRAGEEASYLRHEAHHTDEPREPETMAAGPRLPLPAIRAQEARDKAAQPAQRELISETPD